MLEDNQFALSHALNGVNEAKRLFADQKLKVDRLMAAGDDAREAQHTLGLLEVYLSILERHSETKEATSGDSVTPPGPMRLPPRTE